MKHYVYFLLLGLFMSCSVTVAEDIDFNYQFSANHGIDFSSIRNGPLKITSFTDSRDVDSPNVLVDSDLGSYIGGINTAKNITAIVEDAIKQGFEKGDANLAESNVDLTLGGDITVSEAQITNRGGIESIQMTIRTKVQLRNGQSQLWENTLFGRGYAPVNEGIEGALTQALDRLVDALVNDDYFLLQVL